MKIQRLTFLGVRGLPDASFDFTGRDGGAPHDLVVVTGPPASGMTRALEAIVAAKETIAPYGPMTGDPGGWVAETLGAAKVAIAFRLDEEEQRYAGADEAVVEAEALFSAGRARRAAEEGIRAVLDRYAHGGKIGKVEYFPAGRRVPPLGPFGGFSALEQRLLRASNQGDKYGFIPRFLQSLEGNPEAGRAFADRLALLSPTCRYERTGAVEPMPRCFTSRGGARRKVNQLSQGEVDAVIFAATATAIDLSCSLILVDRPEQHVHPAHLRAFLAGLSALGEGNQIILASASPEVVAYGEERGAVARLPVS